jgi:protein arginine N-methyltransferase 1
MVLDEHRLYLEDRVRLAAFDRAIRKRVRSGDVVLDLGAGTGIFGLLACRAGARRVYCIDDGPIIEMARAIARQNGFADRMIFINERSTEVTLDERIDVVVGDLIGGFGFEAGFPMFYRDAQRRFLKPGGVLIPGAVEMWVAPVEHAGARRQLKFWDRKPAGLDFAPARTIAINTGYPMEFRPKQLLGSPVRAATLQAATTEGAIRFDSTIRVTRKGRLDGIAGWFSAPLAPGVRLTNSPLARDRINRRCVFFPADRPVAVNPGDRVALTMRAIPDELIVSWQVAVLDGRSPSSGRLKGSFSQSTFAGILVARERLRRTRPDYVPTLTPRGRARQSVLELCDRHLTLAEVEREVHRRHGSLWGSFADAQRFVAEVVTRYCE